MISGFNTSYRAPEVPGAFGLDGMLTSTLRAYTAMCREAELVGWPKAYRDDLFRFDRDHLACCNPSPFVWVLRRNGTHLYGIPTADELAESARRVQDPIGGLVAVRKVFGDATSWESDGRGTDDHNNPARWYYWNGRILVPCSSGGAIDHLRAATAGIHAGDPYPWRCEAWRHCGLCASAVLP